MPILDHAVDDFLFTLLLIVRLWAFENCHRFLPKNFLSKRFLIFFPKDFYFFASNFSPLFLVILIFFVAQKIFAERFSSNIDRYFLLWFLGAGVFSHFIRPFSIHDYCWKPYSMSHLMYRSSWFIVYPLYFTIICQWGFFPLSFDFPSLSNFTFAVSIYFYYVLESTRNSSAHHLTYIRICDFHFYFLFIWMIFFYSVRPFCSMKRWWTFSTLRSHIHPSECCFCPRFHSVQLLAFLSPSLYLAYFCVYGSLFSRCFFFFNFFLYEARIFVTASPHL